MSPPKKKQKLVHQKKMTQLFIFSFLIYYKKPAFKTTTAASRPGIPPPKKKQEQEKQKQKQKQKKQSTTLGPTLPFDPLTGPWPDIVLSNQRNLHGVLQKATNSDTVMIILNQSLSISDARQLATTFSLLATRNDVSRLSLVLKCKSSRRPTSILAEGLQALRGLKDIALVLDSTSGQSAKDIVYSLQHGYMVNKPTFLTKLPPEIRHAIVDYALDTWRYGNQFAIRYFDVMSWPRYRSKCCGKCVPAYLILERHCACSQRVAGHSTTCICDRRRKRTALFRTSKLLYEDSMYVLYSKNRMKLVGMETALLFFSTIPNCAFQFMRMIDIRIDEDEYFLYIEQVPEQFAKIISIIKEKCCLRQLHLSIDSAGCAFGLARSWQHEAALGKKMQKNLVNALMPLKELKKLEIYLCGAEPADEDEIEKLIMGKDYKAISQGKIPMALRNPDAVHHHWNCFVEFPEIDM